MVLQHYTLMKWKRVKMKLSDTTISVLKNYSSINQNLKIGAGNNLVTMSAMKNIVAQSKVEETFEKDVAIMIDEAKKIFPNLDELPEEAQQVIVNMTFNMGRPRLSQFKKFIAGVNAGDWNKAAVEMMDSRWAKQVGARAERLRDRIQALA